MVDDEDEQEAKPSQIPLLDDVVDEGVPKKRSRRRRREKNLDLNLEPDPPEIRDLFDDLDDLEDEVAALEKTPASEPAPSPVTDEPTLRAQADDVVERLVKEYAQDIIDRLRGELSQLLDELDEPEPAPSPASARTPSRAVPQEKVWDGPPLEAWDCWLPIEIDRRLERTSAHWSVAGGWAVDLFLKGQSRSHGDIEITVPRDEFDLLTPCFRDCELFTVNDGDVRRLRPFDLIPADVHQIWLVEKATGKWRLDIMLEPGDEETWIYRRDETLRVPRAEITLRRNNIPFLSPEVVLLFKAKHRRDKDEADFRNCLPQLTSDRRVWLRNALTRFHDGHPWLKSL